MFDQRQRLPIAQLSPREMRLIRCLNLYDDPVEAERITSTVLERPLFDRPLLVEVEEVERDLIILVNRGLVHRIGDRYKPTRAGFWSERWLHARDHGISAMEASTYGWHHLQPGDGLFNPLFLTSEQWGGMFDIVSDEHVRSYWLNR